MHLVQVLIQLVEKRLFFGREDVCMLREFKYFMDCINFSSGTTLNISYFLCTTNQLHLNLYNPLTSKCYVCMLAASLLLYTAVLLGESASAEMSSSKDISLSITKRGQRLMILDLQSVLTKGPIHNRKRYNVMLTRYWPPIPPPPPCHTNVILEHIKQKRMVAAIAGFSPVCAQWGKAGVSSVYTA